ncbi:unnamed protein product [Vitrella brassicaformis CCMP3155]|uniref:MD-2-related lipid-recognition domain-containing protein n=1 Tax=Vitrella brassicaformis (strain CCMP3155) TaxID=1169540 RepID=A0A0G4ENG6_VITBC|nr:unnamed protein product [Vitrella brassicaformis CCMP3155]|eukprot:CEL99123.1 unnamed protein product [Vitrella brassicaformis CCMP3155]
MMVRFVLVVVVVSLAVAAAKPQETLKKGKGKGSHRQQPKQTAECLATPIRAFVGEVATLPLSEFLTFAEGLPGGPELLGEAVTNVTVSPPFDDEANGPVTAEVTYFINFDVNFATGDDPVPFERTCPVQATCVTPPTNTTTAAPTGDEFSVKCMDQQLNGSPGEDTSKPITAFARVEGGSGGWKAVGVSVPASFNKMYGPKTKNMGLALKKNIGTQSLILISVPEAKPLKKEVSVPVHFKFSKGDKHVSKTCPVRLMVV